MEIQGNAHRSKPTHFLDFLDFDFFFGFCDPSPSSGLLSSSSESGGVEPAGPAVCELGAGAGAGVGGEAGHGLAGPEAGSAGIGARPFPGRQADTKPPFPQAGSRSNSVCSDPWPFLAGAHTCGQACSLATGDHWPQLGPLT